LFPMLLLDVKQAHPEPEDKRIFIPK